MYLFKTEIIHKTYSLRGEKNKKKQSKMTLSSIMWLY